MQNPVERALEVVPFCFGQILVRKIGGSFALCHRDDKARDDLEKFQNPEVAIEIAKYDDNGNYRPLKTAPNLRHGWSMNLRESGELRRALDHFYPGRLAVFVTWRRDQLRITPLRETLDRQSGMYRVAAKISDEQIDDVIADFCRSNGGCLRTILWKRDQRGAVASAKLPMEKFDPAWDQALWPGSATPGTTSTPAAVPLLCQEPCNLLVAACRKVVKSE
ncbi:MAG TPA: DR2241 family protein [Candidatus Udaeobacter sp.]|nr:DR2241 family protein [Candidatus Udaeobacter sp.]